MEADDIDLSRTHISGPPSRRRYALVAGISIVLGLGFAFFATRWFGAQDRAQLQKLAEFGSAYAEECDAPNFSAPLARLASDTYLHSAALQRVIDEQSQALADGASCEQVTRALRAADFPLPLPPSGRPTVRLQ